MKSGDNKFHNEKSITIINNNHYENNYYLAPPVDNKRVRNKSGILKLIFKVFSFIKSLL